MDTVGRAIENGKIKILKGRKDGRQEGKMAGREI